MSKVDLSQVQWYSRSRGPARIGPSVSINKSGKVVLNDEALSLIGQPEALHIGLLKGGRGKTMLILKAAARSEAGALVLSKQGKSKKSLNATKFLRDNGLEEHFGKAENEPELDEDSDTLAVTL